MKPPSGPKKQTQFKPNLETAQITCWSHWRCSQLYRYPYTIFRILFVLLTTHINNRTKERNLDIKLGAGLLRGKDDRI